MVTSTNTLYHHSLNQRKQASYQANITHWLNTPASCQHCMLYVSVSLIKIKHMQALPYLRTQTRMDPGIWSVLFSYDGYASSFYSLEPASLNEASVTLDTWLRVSSPLPACSSACLTWGKIKKKNYNKKINTRKVFHCGKTLWGWVSMSCWWDSVLI